MKRLSLIALCLLALASCARKPLEITRTPESESSIRISMLLVTTVIFRRINSPARKKAVED